MSEKDLKLIVLQDKFEDLKDAYDEADEDSFLFMNSFAEDILAPVLDNDPKLGTPMWEYMLTKYYGKIPDYEYKLLTNGVIEYTTSYESIQYAFSTSDKICKCVALDYCESHLYFNRFIGKLIFHSNYDLAQKLIDLLLSNDNGNNNPKKNLFELCNDILELSEAKWELNSTGLDFISKLIAQVSGKGKRSRLEAKFVSIAECIENNAPRGAMPFDLFVKDGGFERFLENRAREAQGDSSKTDSFSQYNEQRRLKNKSIEQESNNLESKNFYIDEDKFSAAKEELNDLIGLYGVKSEVTSLCNLMRVRKLRIEKKLKAPQMSQHLVFSGNPGTGKTTVARIIGKIYHALGFLSKGHFVETDRSGLVAGYVGQTALKTQEVINSALGGVLFIDEAYSLAPRYNEDYGAEAIETLLKAMEDHRDDFVVIVAGYDDLMADFIKSNPGLRSRFNKFIHFPDYTGDELMDIFLKLLEKNNYGVDIQLLPVLSEYFKQMYVNRDDNFGNAREVRNLFERVIAKQADRIVTMENPSDKDILEIKIEDFSGIIEGE